MEDYNFDKNSKSITKEERAAFIDRFKKACRAKGMTVQQLQVMLGKTNAYFRNMGYISPKMAKEVKKHIPDLNIAYINKGIGEMFVPPSENKAERETERAIVPLLPISARGGTLMGFSEGINTDECELIVSPVNGAELAVSVTDESMQPEYPYGCIVFIKKINEKAFIEWGRTFVIDTCNGILIKKLFPDGSDGSKITCKSVNSEYPDFTIKNTDVYGMYKVLLQMSLR